MTLKQCYLETEREELMKSALEMLGFNSSMCMEKKQDEKEEGQEEEEEGKENKEAEMMKMCYSSMDIQKECFIEIDAKNTEQKHCM